MYMTDVHLREAGKMEFFLLVRRVSFLELNLLCFIIVLYEYAPPPRKFWSQLIGSLTPLALFLNRSLNAKYHFMTSVQNIQ